MSNHQQEITAEQYLNSIEVLDGVMEDFVSLNNDEAFRTSPWLIPSSEIAYKIDSLPHYRVTETYEGWRFMRIQRCIGEHATHQSTRALIYERTQDGINLEQYEITNGLIKPQVSTYTQFDTGHELSDEVWSYLWRGNLVRKADVIAVQNEHIIHPADTYPTYEEIVYQQGRGLMRLYERIHIGENPHFDKDKR